MTMKKGMIAEEWLKKIKAKEGVAEVFVGIVKDGEINVSIDGKVESMLAMVQEMGRMVKMSNAN